MGKAINELDAVGSIVDATLVPVGETNTLALLVEPGGVSLSVEPGGVDFFWMPGAEDAVAVTYRRRKHYTRKDDLLEIYAANPQDAPVNDPVIRNVRIAKPVRQEKPEQTIPLKEIESLAREYDQLQAYRQALKNKQYERIARLYERLQDEQDVEILLMYA